MKKKLIILIIFLAVILVITCTILFKNKIVSTITLDINPSIKINLDKKENVVSIIALNSEAKGIISNDMKGKTIDKALDTITKNIIDKGYIDENYVAIILHTEGNIKNSVIESKIKNSFEETLVQADIIVIDKVTKEDEKLAKEYNVSPAKVNYIKSIISENEKIKIDDFSSKSVNEIRDTKETGFYCLNDYKLEGSWCIKEMSKKTPKEGETCPQGYFEYKGKCYEETRIEDTGNISCPEGFKLENEECVNKDSIPAVATSYTCSKGMVRTKAEVGMAPKGSGGSDEPVCVDTEVTHPVTICNLPASDPTERTSYGGKCYWHRAPVIEAGCPGKIQINGFCWDDATDIYLCPNNYNSNTRTKDDNCYKVLKNVKPIASGYKCENDEMILEGNKCINIQKIDVIHERKCEKDSTLIENDMCINLNKSTDKINGLICDEDYTLKNNECVKYEFIEAEHY